MAAAAAAPQRSAAFDVTHTLKTYTDHTQSRLPLQTQPRFTRIRCDSDRAHTHTPRRRRTLKNTEHICRRQISPAIDFPHTAATTTHLVRCPDRTTNKTRTEITKTAHISRRSMSKYARVCAPSHTQIPAGPENTIEIPTCVARGLALLLERSMCVRRIRTAACNVLTRDSVWRWRAHNAHRHAHAHVQGTSA